MLAGGYPAWAVKSYTNRVGVPDTSGLITPGLNSQAFGGWAQCC